jgi:hypothetical protein
VLQEVNAIRHRFGLAPGRETRVFQSTVERAAEAGTDPLVPFGGPIVEEFGVSGLDPGGSALEAVDSQIVTSWVYEDHWNGVDTPNLDCTSPRSPGCDAHRRAILSSPPSPGDHLYIDVAVTQARWRGTSAVSVAALLVWSAPGVRP